MTTTSGKSVNLEKYKDPSTKVDEELLLSIREEILNDFKNSTDQHKEVCGICYGYNVLTLVSDHWVNFIGNLPIMVIVSNLNYGQFGNNWGGFLPSIGCANLTGAHVVHVNLHFRKREYGQGEEAFFEAVPKVIVNQNPAKNKATMMEKSEQIGCSIPETFPWDIDTFEEANEMIYSFRPIVRASAEAQMRAFGFFHNYTSTLFHPHIYAHLKDDRHNVKWDQPNLADILTAEELAQLPRYPDVSIHYRCHDNILFDGMGLLPFQHILEHIPTSAKYIFILTEGFENMKHICGPILDALQNDIKFRFPKAHVVIRRGGHIIEVVSFFINSPLMVMCSASTFCFFTATSNIHAKVYIPRRQFMGKVIEIANIHPLNASGINYWTLPNGTNLDSYAKLVPSLMLDILRNRSYPYQCGGSKLNCFI